MLSYNISDLLIQLYLGCIILSYVALEHTLFRANQHYCYCCCYCCCCCCGSVCHTGHAIPGLSLARYRKPPTLTSLVFKCRLSLLFILCISWMPSWNVCIRLYIHFQFMNLLPTEIRASCVKTIAQVLAVVLAHHETNISSLLVDSCTPSLSNGWSR